MLAGVHPELEKLTRVLDLERRQGAQDRAVIGGLEAFLSHWRGEAQGRVDADLLGRIEAALEGYGTLDVEARQARLASIEALLQRLALSGGEAPAGATARPDAVRTGKASASGPGAASIADAPEAAPASEASGRGRAGGKPPEGGSLALDTPVTGLKGIGPKASANLQQLGIRTLGDLLYHAPARYKDFSALKRINALSPGEETTIIGTVWDLRLRKLPQGRTLLTVVLNDTTASIACTFFNQPFLEREIHQGDTIVVSGKVELWAGRLTIRAPEWERLDRELIHTGRLVPIYPLTQGISQRWLRRQIHQAVALGCARVEDPLPASLRAEAEVLPLADALRRLHEPADQAEVEAATTRLAFDELLVLQLWHRRRRAARLARPGRSLGAGTALRQAYLAGLPFAPTAAQERTILEISADLERPLPMSRLLQGDVGSGKTAVAAAAIAQCVGAGYQAALMVPTEILAEQHFQTLLASMQAVGAEAFDPRSSVDVVAPPVPALPRQSGLRIARLVGSMRPADKAATAAALAAGTVDLVVGTHAVIQETVRFARLGLAIVDEQHRFGVLQRAELQVRGAGDAPDEAPPLPHLLIMSATPIPRTLAQVLNGDLDQSVIDELPPGRKAIRTYWLSPEERERAYAYIRHRVQQGEQAYIVCPLVEDSETIAARAAVPEHERLTTEVMPDLRLGLLHGRMRPAEKDAVMLAFKAGELDVLVSTTVIEVGVDVPKASVMLIDGADRFGLAQLHQIRGRVGRGAAESVCLLLAEDPSSTASERLAWMTKTNDGLALAEQDLKLRGPGDYFGLRQAGYLDRFRFARRAPAEVLARAHRIATALVDADPGLGGPGLEGLRARVEAFQAQAEPV